MTMKICPMKSLAAAVLLLAATTTGCATKKYVGEQVAGSEAKTSERVGGVETELEKTQMTVREHGEKITATSKTAQEALDRAIAAGQLAEGKFLYETVLSDDKVKFSFNKAELSAEATAALDAFATQLKGDNKNVFIEIQGHTDNIGGEAYNEELGMERAEAARRYLSKQGVPLHRMQVISYGETEAVADNKTREGRSQNRRVVLVVLQ
jgi:outer membrane protein OmpA-like peptidoglycan-associated protein